MQTDKSSSILGVDRSGDARDVLQPVGSTISDRPDRGYGRRLRRPRVNWPFEIARILLGLLGLTLALILIGTCCGIAYGSYKMIGVLNEIAERDFGKATQRFERYAAKFKALEGAGFKVVTNKPKVLEGVTTCLWVVQPLGSTDRLVYRWKHNLKTNLIEPASNPALLLDLALGYVAPSDAADYDFYDPNDKLAQAVAQQDFSFISPQQLARQFSITELPAGPVLPPLMTPEEARKRGRPAEPEEEAAEAAATGEDPTAPGDSTEVGDGSSAPRQDGDGTEVNPPDDDSVPVSPPHDDAVPVE